jgi:hypothetical protein
VKEDIFVKLVAVDLLLLRWGKTTAASKGPIVRTPDVTSGHEAELE